MKILHIIILAVLLLPIRTVCVSAEPVPSHTDSIRTGVLPNGLHYYLAVVPDEHIALRLALGVGSYHERTKGVAHYIEHLAFAGSQHFKGKAAVQYWERLGMRFGRDINAYTGHDRTVYTISHPRTTHNQLDTTIWALSEFIHKLSLNRKAIEQERKIILAELKSYVQDDAFYPLKIGTGKDNRLPIGTTKEVEAITPEQLQQYYREWYEPQRAHIIIAGPIHPDSTEQMIRTRFADIPKGQNHYHPKPTLHYRKGLTIQTVTDSLMEQDRWEIIIPHRTQTVRTPADKIKHELLKAITACINQRMAYRRQRINADNSWYLYDTDQLSFSFAGNTPDKLHQQVTAIAAELNSLRQQGMTTAEWEEVRQRLDAVTTEKMYSAAAVADEWAAAAVTGDTVPQRWSRQQLAQAVQQCTPEQVKEVAASWINAADRHLLLAIRHNGRTTKNYSKANIMQWWNDGLKQVLAQPQQKKTENKTQLVAAPPFISEHIPADTTYTDKKVLPKLGITTVKLKNGLHIVIKPTQSEQLTATLIGRGGLAQLSPERYHKLESTAAYMEMGGVDQLPHDHYVQWTSQQDIMLNIGINDHIHQIMGMAPAQQYGALVRMMSRRITANELRYDDFEQARQDELDSYGKQTMLERMIQRDAQRQTAYIIDSIVGNISPQTFVPKTMEDIGKQHLDSMARWYKQLFTNSPTTLILVGRVPPLHTIVAEANHAFGRFDCHDRPTPNVTAVWHTADTTRYVQDERHDKEVHLLYGQSYKPSLREELKLKLMRDVIQNRLISELRERKGLTYSPYVVTQQTGLPLCHSSIEVVCATDTAKSKTLVDEWQKIAEQLCRTIIDENELNTIKRSFKTTKAQVLNHEATAQWRELITRLYADGITLDEYEQYDETLDSISTEELRKAFCKYLKHKTTIILQP